MRSLTFSLSFAAAITYLRAATRPRRLHRSWCPPASPSPPVLRRERVVGRRHLQGRRAPRDDQFVPELGGGHEAEPGMCGEAPHELKVVREQRGELDSLRLGQYPAISPAVVEVLQLQDPSFDGVVVLWMPNTEQDSPALVLLPANRVADALILPLDGRRQPERPR